MKTEHWKEEPDKKDYPAALNYLSLLVSPSEAKIIVKALKHNSQIEHFAAKDLFRASGLPHLAEDDHEVQKDLNKVKSGEKLSPVLLVRGTPIALVAIAFSSRLYFLIYQYRSAVVGARARVDKYLRTTETVNLV